MPELATHRPDGRPTGVLHRSAALLPPPPPRVQRRPTVERALGSAGAMTLVHAPPGFGATTAVSAWARRELAGGRPVLWVSAHDPRAGGRVVRCEPAASVPPQLPARIDEALSYVTGRGAGAAPGLNELAGRIDAERAVLVVDDIGPGSRGAVEQLARLAHRLTAGRVVAITSTHPHRRLVPGGGGSLAHSAGRGRAHRTGAVALPPGAPGAKEAPDPVLELTIDDLAVAPDEVVAASSEAGIALDPDLAEHLTTGLAGWTWAVYRALDDLEQTVTRGGALSADLVAAVLRRHQSRALHELPGDVVELMLGICMAQDFDLADLRELSTTPSLFRALATLEDVGVVRHAPGRRGDVYALHPRVRAALVPVARRHHPTCYGARAARLATARVARGDVRRGLLLELESGDVARVERSLVQSWARLLDGDDDRAPDAVWAAVGETPPVRVPPRLVAFLTAVRPPLGAVRVADGPPALPSPAEDPVRADALETFVSVVRLRRSAQRTEALAEARAWLGHATPDVPHPRDRTPRGVPGHDGAAAAATALVALQGALAALESGCADVASELAQRAHRETLGAGLLHLAAAGAEVASLAEALGHDLRGARAWLEEAGALPQAPGWWRTAVGDVRGLVYALAALASADDERAVRAETSEAVRDSAATDLWFVGLHVEALAGAVGGSPDAAADHLRASLVRRGFVRSRSRTPDLARTPPLVTADLGRLYLAMGRGTTAATVESALPPRNALRTLLHARIALARGDGDDALRSAAPLTGCDVLPVGQRTEAHVVTAEALRLAGDREGTRAELARAASFARRHGSLLPFRWTSRAVLADLLADADGSTRDLLAPFLREVDAPRTVEFVQLPERQLLVLQALADGRTGPEIARDFFVSRNTVKTQVREIYRRLGVHDRASAVRKAQDLGLLDPIIRPAGRRGPGSR